MGPAAISLGHWGHDVEGCVMVRVVEGTGLFSLLP